MVTLLAKHEGIPAGDEWFQSLPLPCCIFNEEQQLIAFSRRAEALFGIAAGDILGKTPHLWQAINIADKKPLSHLMLQLLRGESTRETLELTHKLANQEVLLCEWHFSLKVESTGARRILCLIRELNSSRNQQAPVKKERGLLDFMLFSNLRSQVNSQSEELRQLNRILQERDARLSTIFNNAPVGITVINADSYYTGEVNPAYADMLGYSLEEIQKLSVDVITHPDDLRWNKELIGEMLAGKMDRADYEKRFLHKNGSVVWAKASVSPIKDDDGKVFNVVSVVQDITAQKLAEQSLAQQVELGRMGGKLAKLGSWTRDPGISSASFWSDELYEIYEMETRQPLPIDKVFAMVLPQYRSISWESFDALTMHGKRMDYECEIQTFKGNHKWLRVVGEVLRDQSGVISKIIGAVQDITERKQREAEAKQMSDQVSATLDTMSDAFMILDRNWEMIYMNKATEKVLKLDRNMLRRGSVWERQPWLKSTPIYEQYHKAMNERVAVHCEYYSQRLHEWIEAHAYPCDEGIAVYFHLITEQKLLAAQVQESEQKLKYVTKAVLDVMWERNLYNDTITWDSGLRKFGYPGNTEDGRSITSSMFWLQRIHPLEKDAVINSFDQVLKGKHDHWEATYRFQQADGSYIHVMDRGVVFRDRELQPARMIGGLTDISERIRLEEHLQQSQRIESIGKLTGGLAHDFNNLLTVIVGNVELLQHQIGMDSDLAHMTESISSAALRGAELTQRLLAFARRQALEPAAVNLNRLLLQMEGMLKRTLGRNIDVRIVGSRGLHNALVDASQLESAILNLCINSRDAMPTGGQIVLETMNATLVSQSPGFVEEVVPGDYVVIKVTDNGSGIAPEQMRHVFEPFFTTKDRGKGTGLGLSTVYGFVRQSNGHVTISSRLGVGTEIAMYFPVTLQQERVIDQREQETKFVGGNETILLVEDEPSVSSFSSQFLSSLGYRVLVAENAVQALNLLMLADNVDLLFTDVIMPGGMDGGELAKQALALKPGLKVLYTSGYTENALLKEGKLDSLLNFLSKPYTLASMAARIRRTLDNGLHDHSITG